MKLLKYIVLTLLLSACNGENVPDCFQNSGDIVRKDVQVESFSKITVFDRAQLILRQGPERSVTIESGEYLIDDVEVFVKDDRLHVKNENSCNLTRDYGITKVYVTTPELTEIRNSSGLTIMSAGILKFDSLALISEDFEEEDKYHTDGDFNLDVECNKMFVVINNLSTVYLRGSVDTIDIGYYSGDARFEGAELVAEQVKIFQRSSNDMILNVQQSITGEIRGTGDVILLNRPPIVDIEQFYTGKLIFN